MQARYIFLKGKKYLEDNKINYLGYVWYTKCGLQQK